MPRWPERTLRDRFEEKFVPEPMSGCWLWTASIRVSAGGYGQIRVRDKMQTAHQVSWELYKGSRNGLHVLHKCDVPSCVNPEHLFLGTHAENMADCSRKGRMHPGDACGSRKHPESVRRGERHQRCKLTDSNVIEIRSSKLPTKELAKTYGVSVVQINRVKVGTRRG